MPDQRRRFGQAVSAQQSLRIQLAKLHRSIFRAGERIKHEDGGANLLVRDQAFGVTNGDRFICRILGVGTLVPLIRFSARGFRCLRKFEKSRGCRLSISYFGRKLAEPDKISIRGVERHHPLHHRQRIRYARLTCKFFERALVRFKRQFAIGILEQLRKPDLLLTTWICKSRQLLVREAGPHGISSGQLPFEKLAEQVHSLGQSLQGKAQVCGHLANSIVGRVHRQGLQKFFESLASFAFLQQLLAALNPPSDLLPISPFWSLSHWEGGPLRRTPKARHSEHSECTE